MKLIKGFIAAAIAASLLVLPAGALAKGRDRDHDRMPDKWEKKHHLNPHAKDARRDPDRDHLSNLSEFRHHTDPRKADTDDDGVRDDDELRDHTNPRREDSDDDGIGDADEISGTIVSFENGVLTLRLPGEGAGTVSGAVNNGTEIKCDDEDDDNPTASASHDGSDDNSGPGSDSSGSGRDGGDDDRGEDDDNQRACTVADLKPGARVHEAELGKAGDGSTVFKEIELVPSS
jgi:hypothetical protein